MRIGKKIGLAVLACLIAIQFIRPARNTSAQPQPQDISSALIVPPGVRSRLQDACYDCHSNNTRYPWYANTQPFAWLLASHIREGKEALNFNEFGSYSLRRQQSQLKSIVSQIRDGEMPLSSYTLLHPSAQLSKEEKQQIITWATAAQDSLRRKEDQ